jgi:hypothetical protein
MYQVYWYIPDYVLCVKITDSISSDELTGLGAVVTMHLLDIETRVALLIDITEATQMPFPTDVLKRSQTYIQNPMLKWLLVVGQNKLMRLMLLMMFSLARPSLQFFDNFEMVQNHVQIHKLNHDS